MKIAIVILNWNRKKDTIDCLESVDRLRIPSGYELKVYLVDNGSTDGSILAFSRLTAPSFQLIENKKNFGYVGGNNIGMRHALSNGTDWVFVLNNDVLLDRNLLINFAKCIEENKNIDIVSPKIYFAPGYEYHKERYPKSLLGKVIWYAGGVIDWKNCYATNFGVDDVDRGQFDQEREIDFATGTAFFVRRGILDKIGLFDEKYYLYLEDVDFSLRIRKGGGKILYCPKMIIWHKVSQSSSIGGNLNDYFLTRNRLFFGVRYAPLRTKMALVKESFKLLITGRKWQKYGARDFYLGRFGRGSWK